MSIRIPAAPRTESPFGGAARQSRTSETKDVIAKQGIDCLRDTHQNTRMAVAEMEVVQAKMNFKNGGSRYAMEYSKSSH